MSRAQIAQFHDNNIVHSSRLVHMPMLEAGRAPSGSAVDPRPLRSSCALQHVQHWLKLQFIGENAPKDSAEQLLRRMLVTLDGVAKRERRVLKHLLADYSRLKDKSSQDIATDIIRSWVYSSPSNASNVKSTMSKTSCQSIG